MPNEGKDQANQAIVALGSNLGDSERILREAMDKLRELGESDFICSTIHRTAPVDCPAGSPDFLNAAVMFRPKPGETPESILAKLQALEKQFGRAPKKVVNEARRLDLDLIAFGAEKRQSPELALPHPRAHLRKFVLGPLAEIAPELRLPGQKKTIRELYQALG